ncbi:MAG TPA: tetratricopeptide repeat protein [Terriglobales bacterium]|nr:tetratricopeptide repeat protein [Terriglobales bacterium]
MSRNRSKRTIPKSSPHVGLVLVFLFIALLPFQIEAQDKSGGFEDLALRASAAREQNDLPKAVDLYGQALQLNPKWPDGWWFLGLLQYGSDQYAAARDALTQYIKLTPNAGPAIALRGLCEFETGEYGPSLQDIQHGLSLGAANQPRNAHILRYHEALLLTRAGAFDDALQKFGLLARDGVTNPELFVAIGLAGLRTPIFPRDLASNLQELYLATGNATFQFMAGNEPAAQQLFQDVFQHFPATPNAHYLYGYLLFAKDPDAAIVQFKAELEAAPENASAHAMLAWASLMRNNPSEALPNAEKAVGEQPALPMAQLVLGRSSVETGNLKGGIEHLEKALQLEPDNLETHLALAKAYSKSGRADDARRERLQCLQLTKNDSPPIAQP